MYEAGSIISIFIIIFGVISLVFCNKQERKEYKNELHKNKNELHKKVSELDKKKSEFEEFMDYYIKLEVPIWPGHSEQEVKSLFGENIPFKVPDTSPKKAYSEWERQRLERVPECAAQN